MKQWVADLLALQNLDMKIRNLQTRLETIPAETMQNITSTAMQNYQMQGQAPTIIVQDTQNPNQSVTIKNISGIYKILQPL